MGLDDCNRYEIDGIFASGSPDPLWQNPNTETLPEVSREITAEEQAQADDFPFCEIHQVAGTHCGHLLCNVPLHYEEGPVDFDELDTAPPDDIAADFLAWPDLGLSEELDNARRDNEPLP